jgi:hypothetical protein
MKKKELAAVRPILHAAQRFAIEEKLNRVRLNEVVLLVISFAFRCTADSFAKLVPSNLISVESHVYSSIKAWKPEKLKLAEARYQVLATIIIFRSYFLMFKYRY